MKDREKLGFAWVWVMAVDTVLQRGATGNKHALRLFGLMEEVKFKAWFFGVCLSLYLAKKGRYVSVVAVGCGLLQHLGKV